MAFAVKKIGRDHVNNDMKGQSEEKWLEVCNRMMDWCESRIITCSPIEELFPNQVKLIMDAASY
jgi:hypothetical protein